MTKENTEKKHYIVAKLGGSNMKTAEDFFTALNTLISLRKKHPQANLVFVFSALFNLTNELEVLATLYLQKDLFWRQKLVEIEKRLNDFTSRLFVFKHCPEELQETLRQKWTERRKQFENIFESNLEDGELRDMVLAEGESQTLFMINLFLPLLETDFVCVDPKEVIKTDENFGSAEILFDLTTDLVKKKFAADSEQAGKIFITAGFIGTTKGGVTTTVGREGSDYVAAILAKILKADYLYLFKDVGAIFESMENRKVIEKISYQDLNERIEKTGPIKAIHPKVVTALADSNIAILIADPKTGVVGTTIE